MKPRLLVVVVVVLLSVLPAMAQQATRADFNELAKALVGRWVGDVTLGKKARK